MVTGILTAGCFYKSSTLTPVPSDTVSLVGAWRGHVQFKTGAFAAVKDLEFMYVFNAGGTMTESSNYDASPPVPPAYGVWRRTGPRQYGAKYAIYATRPPAAFEDLAKGNGWLPAGQGVFVQTITLAEDGNTFTSTIKYDAYDADGNPTETGSEAEAKANRVSF